MKPEESHASEERWTDLLAAFDDMLAGGGTDPLATTDIPSDRRSELQEKLAYAERVRRALAPRVASGSATALRGTAQPAPSLLELGRFELLEVVGSGGFGTVYRARDPRLDRVVAIKVPRAGELANAYDVERFLREARSVAQLRHPGIVPIYEVGQQRGVPYLVSEFVQGTTLSELLKGRRLGTGEAARMTVAIADALQYSHEHGVVHRDVKPSNILVDTAGMPHLMDFGLARREAVDITMTAEGDVLGTPAYMSPEQAGGKGHHVDGRCDIYSLGVVFYQMLTGELPFQGTMRAVLNQVMQQEPRPLRSLNDEIPRDLETICLKAMAKEPGRRYQTAAAMADDLRCFLAGKPITARPVGRAERLWRWCKRNPVVATLAAAVMLSLVAGTAISTYFAIAEAYANDQVQTQFQRANDQFERANREARAAEAAEKRKDELLTRAEWMIYASRINAAQREWDAGNVKAAWQHLDACRCDFRGWEHAYLYSLFTRNQRTFYPRTPGVPSVVFSPDGKHIACAVGTLKVFELDTGREVLSIPKSRVCVAYSPDGKLLLSGGGVDNKDYSVKVWDVAQGRLVQSLVGHAKSVTCVAISADGTRIASGAWDNVVKVWDAAKGKELLTLKRHTSWSTSIAFSADGKRLASTGADGTLMIWEVDKGREVVFLKAPLKGQFIGSDGKRIVSAAADNSLTVWDVDNVKEVVTLRGHIHPVSCAAFSADGTRVVSGGFDNTVKLWDVGTGLLLASFKGHTKPVQCVAISRDGKHIASGSMDGTLKVWPAEGQEPLPLKGHDTVVEGVAISPDGKRLASSTNGTQIWDAEKGQIVLSVPWAFNRLSFSPDGKRIVSSKGNTVMVGNAGTGKVIKSFEGHRKGVASVTYSGDGTRIASGGGDNTVKVWDAAKGQELLTLNGLKATVYGVAFSPDGKRVAGGAWDNLAKVWDSSTGRELLTLRGHTRGISSLAFSPDGKRIASSGLDSTVKIWNADTGAELLTLRGHTNCVTGVAFSPDGKRIFSGSQDFTIKVWQADIGQELLTLKGHTDTVNGLAISADGKRLVSGSQDETLRLWEADRVADILTHRGHSLGINSVVISRDGKRIVTGSKDWTVRIWDAEQVRDAVVLMGHAKDVTSVALSADGKRIASGSGDKTVKVWDAAKGQEILSLSGHDKTVLSVAFSVDGKRIASGSYDKTVKVWDVDKGQEVLSLQGHAGEVASLAFSPDGARIASGSADHTIKVWDAVTGQAISSLHGHTDIVYGVAFSPDGKRIVSGGRDGTAKVWDAGTGQEVLTLKGHGKAVTNVAFSPDGASIASIGYDFNVRIWDAATGKEISTFSHTGGKSTVAFNSEGLRIVSCGASGDSADDHAVKVWTTRKAK